MVGFDQQQSIRAISHEYQLLRGRRHLDRSIDPCPAKCTELAPQFVFGLMSLNAQAACVESYAIPVSHKRLETNGEHAPQGSFEIGQSNDAGGQNSSLSQRSTVAKANRFAKFERHACSDLLAFKRDPLCQLS